MREILFRGFHERADGDTTIFVDGREVRGRWVEGLPGYDINGQVSEIQHFNSPTICSLFDIIPTTRGEYTGLTDKNGKKIFEGDIMQCQDRAVYVCWNHPNGTWDCNFIRYVNELCSNGITPVEWKYRATVIGTIFDNAQEVAK